MANMLWSIHVALTNSFNVYIISKVCLCALEIVFIFRFLSFDQGCNKYFDSHILRH